LTLRSGTNEIGNSNFRELQIPILFLVIFVIERLRQQFFTCYQIIFFVRLVNMIG